MLVEAGYLAAAITTIGTLGGAVIFSRVGRWLGRKIMQDLKATLHAEFEIWHAAMLAELRPNGGKSLRDSVDRTERSMEGLKEDFCRLVRRLEKVEAQILPVDEG